MDRASPVIKGQKLVKTHQKVQVSTCHYVDRYPSIRRGLHTKLVFIYFYTFIFDFNTYIYTRMLSPRQPQGAQPKTGSIPRSQPCKKRKTRLVSSNRPLLLSLHFLQKLQRRYFWKRNKISNVEILLCVLAC